MEMITPKNGSSNNINKALFYQYLNVDKKIFDFELESQQLGSFNEIKKEFFDFSSNKHLKVFPSKEAFLYKCKITGEFELDENNNKIARKIFEGKSKFLEKEYKALESLASEILDYNKKNPQQKLILPNNWQEYETLKILQACKFDNNAAIANLIAYIEFKLNYFPLKLTDKAIEILSKTGFLYCHGRDRSFRPILVCCAESYLNNIKKYSYDDWINAIVFFSEYIIKHMMIPGQVESWNIISDLNNISLFGLPTDFHKFLKFLQTNYRGRLNINFIFGMNRFLDFLWRIIKNFLHSNVEKKICFINENNKSLVFDLILPEHLEQKYGGKAANLFERSSGSIKFNAETKSLFPPHLPDSDPLSLADKENLFSEEEYLNLCKEGRISKISPYIAFNTSRDNSFLITQRNLKTINSKGILAFKLLI